MSYRDIRGQDSAVSFLKASSESGRISHAHLFIGPSGTGRKLSALNFAKAMNCLGGAGEKPCDVCISCKKIDSSNHPDVFLLKPDKDGASIKIDSIRELIRLANLKPYEGKKKVYIIDDAEAMGHEAQNALLKTLEEPPANSVIIMITEQADVLLPTVTSRAQVVKFFPIPEKDIKEELVNKYGMNEMDADTLAELSSGSIGKALKYKDASFGQMRSRILKALAENTLFDSDFDRISKTDLKVCLDIMLTWYRDILVMKTAGDRQSVLFNKDKRKAIMMESNNIEIKKLEFIIKQIISTAAFLEQNVNPKLAMASLGVAICTK